MIKLPSKKKNTIPPIVAPGWYKAQCLSVQWDDDFANDGAFIVSYELTPINGGPPRQFRETFFNSLRFKRTAEIADLLERMGTDNVDDMVGQTFKVEVKKNVTKQGQVKPTITARSLWEPEDEVQKDVEV